MYLKKGKKTRLFWIKMVTGNDLSDTERELVVAQMEEVHLASVSSW